MDSFNTNEAASLAAEIVLDIKNNELDNAQKRLIKLCCLCRFERDINILAVIAIQRGQLLDAWHVVNRLPDHKSPDLKAFCRYMLDDPLWQQYASLAQESKIQ